MNKLSVRDKCILLVLLLGFLLYAGYNFLWIPTNEQIAALETEEQDLKGKIGDQTPLAQQIKSLEEENKQLLQNIDEYRTMHGGKSLNKEDFLMFLGKQCNDNDTELIKFNDLGTTNKSNNVWKIQFDFELRGTLSNLNRICKAIDDIGIRYSVGGISLRQNDNLAYLTRFFDDISKLEWYKDETPLPEENAEENTEPDDFVFPDEFFNNNQGAAGIPSITPIPEATPMPTPTPPQDSVPTPEPKDESITDRLDKLLEITSYRNSNYGFVLLTNNDMYSQGISQNNTMRLNITIEFTVYSDPKNFTNSFLMINSEV